MICENVDPHAHAQKIETKESIGTEEQAQAYNKYNQTKFCTANAVPGTANLLVSLLNELTPFYSLGKWQEFRLGYQ